MNITIISVGKIKETYFKNAINEYTKRLSKYTKLQIIEVNDEHAPDNISEKDIEKIKTIEGNRVLAKLKRDDYIITLEIKGKELTSIDLAKKLDELPTYGNSKITFVIGGSFGLSQEVSNKANFKLSFSKMTYPHQLMRVILLEQIYRSFRINNNEPYHK